uniref:Putative major facilitator superfamily MFS_1 protein n=1 Tax=uncultured bacterium 888 TaxID=548896 RepID=B8R8Q1_9BACT|nr:putative major facilitator superfamily MFS_1 protein [uncultured bacterium 888]
MLWDPLDYCPRETRSTSRDARRTVGLAVFCQTVHWLSFAAIPLLLPLIREDLQIGFAEAGMISVAGALSYMLGQVPSGYLADRCGPKRLVFVGLLGWSLLSVSFGLIHVFWLALVNQFFAGFFRALLFVPGITLLASWFPLERRATAMSLVLVGGAVGSVLLSLAGPVLAQAYGWRPTFIAFASIGIGAAVLFGAYAKDRPQAALPRAVSLASIVGIVRQPVMWVCCGLQFVRFAVVMGFGFWLPSFLVAERGMSVQVAGLVMAMSAALSAPSNTIGAYLSDRLKNPPVVIGGALGFLACASMLLPWTRTLPQVLAVVGLFSVFVGAYFGPLFLVPVEVLGPRVAGTASGIANLFANIGGLISVAALGVIKDQAGSFAWGFVGVGSVCLIGVVLAVALGRIRMRTLIAPAGMAKAV